MEDKSTYRVERIEAHFDSFEIIIKGGGADVRTALRKGKICRHCPYVAFHIVNFCRPPLLEYAVQDLNDGSLRAYCPITGKMNSKDLASLRPQNDS